jgi:hypothetical protein
MDDSRFISDPLNLMRRTMSHMPMVAQNSFSCKMKVTNKRCLSCPYRPCNPPARCACHSRCGIVGGRHGWYAQARVTVGPRGMRKMMSQRTPRTLRLNTPVKQEIPTLYQHIDRNPWPRGLVTLTAGSDERQPRYPARADGGA